MKPDKLVSRHVFNFSPKENGGESLTLKTEWMTNGDEDIENPKDCMYAHQELTLQSYCNSASFSLSGIILTADILRKLANDLDRFELEVCEKYKKMVVEEGDLV